MPSGWGNLVVKGQESRDKSQKMKENVMERSGNMNETDRGIGDESVSDQELQRYGQQLQNLLDQTEQRLRDSEGETMTSDPQRSTSDMARSMRETSIW